MKVPNIDKAQWVIEKYQSVADSLKEITSPDLITEQGDTEKCVRVDIQDVYNVHAWVPYKVVVEMLEKLLVQYRKEVEEL